MGKPYANEIENFGSTYEWALDNKIDELTSFVHYASKTPLYVIGSGGSFTATTFASMLHQQIGMIARCLTPLEFLSYENIGKNNSILIVTAGGNNKDILSTFDKAIKLESKNLGVLCASTNNKLTKKAEQFPRVFLNQARMPTKKDGFLATNSLIALSLWMLRAYIRNFSLDVEIPENIVTLVCHDSDETEFRESLKKKLSDFQKIQTIVVLYDGWGKTAAVDIESKLVEAGLNNVQLADYRNFAHGRHNWIGKNPDSTGVVALINPDCHDLATKTLNFIPKGIPRVELVTKYSGPVGALSLLIQVMYAVKIFGDFREIDPGRPGVATFGRKIYHLSIPKSKTKSDFSQMEYVAIKRKFGEITDNNSFDTKLILLKKFLKKIETTTFDAIVFDYDGTLCDLPNRFKQPSSKTVDALIEILQKKIPLGIATGRGKSVRNELQKVIPKEFWPNVFVGYYNCADIATLDKDEHPDTDSPIDPNLDRFLNYLKTNEIINEQMKIEPRPKQISLSADSLSALDLIRTVYTMNPEILDTVKIVESSHSLDIISKDVSKLNLLEKIRKEMNCKNILCLGDRGLWPGNDFELLATPYSLSVDEVSGDPNSCWNLSPLGHKGEQSLISYLKCITIQNNNFRFNSTPLVK